MLILSTWTNSRKTDGRQLSLPYINQFSESVLAISQTYSVFEKIGLSYIIIVTATIIKNNIPIARGQNHFERFV
jgi:hypothetical protein